MIFGKNNQLKKEAEQKKIAQMVEGVEQFAWIPIKLVSGEWCWLETYIARYSSGIHMDGSLFLWSSSPNFYHPDFTATRKLK